MAANSKKRVETKEFHRRQRCFPESRSTHFFKILLPFTIEEKKLRIPEKFIHEFGDKLSDIVTLSDPNCRQWKVGLEKNKESVWFSEGWNEFLEYYSIKDNYFLVFRYEGNSKFQVVIFDLTATEIQYSCNDPINVTQVDSDYKHGTIDSKNNDDNHMDGYNDNDLDDKIDHGNEDVKVKEQLLEDEEDDEDNGNDDDDDEDEEEETEDDDSDESYCSSPSESRPYHHKSKAFTKLPDRRTLRKNYNPPTKSSFDKKRKRSAKTSESEHGDSDTSENEFKDKQEEEHVDCHLATKCCSKSYKKKLVSEDDRDKVISAADDYKTTNPSFKVVLKPHNIYNSFVYVPAGFGLKYFKHESVNVVLLTSKGRKWQARCFYREGSGCGRSIGKGFAQFSRDNNLEEGDVCVFELIDKKKFMLEVTIFRLDDYVTKSNSDTRL